MKKFIMGMGMPASGKTTALKEFARRYGYDYVCPDDLRLELYGKIEYHISRNDNSWKLKNKKVWEEAKKRVKEALERGNTVVFDAVFNDIEKRKEFLDFVKESGAGKIQGVYVDAPIDIVKKRNKERSRKVPDQIVDEIAANFEKVKPKIEEGFDSIFTLDECQNLIEAEMKGCEGNFKKDFR